MRHLASSSAADARDGGRPLPSTRNLRPNQIQQSKLGQPYLGFRIAAIGGSRLLYPFNGNAVTDSGNGHLLDSSLATGGTTPPKANEVADVRQSHCVAACFIGGTPCGSPNSITGGNVLRLAFLSGRCWFVFDGVLFSRVATGIPVHSACGQGGGRHSCICPGRL